MPTELHDPPIDPSPDTPISADANVQPAADETTEEHAEPNQSVKKSPMAPSKAMREDHEAMGHAVFRNWCGACVKGRGRNDSHCRKERGEGETPVLSWDYGFLSAKGTETKQANRTKIRKKLLFPVYHHCTLEKSLQGRSHPKYHKIAI